MHVSTSMTHVVCGAGIPAHRPSHPKASAVTELAELHQRPQRRPDYRHPSWRIAIGMSETLYCWADTRPKLFKYLARHHDRTGTTRPLPHR